jgi:DNA-binding HxlR family transcriptional regulator
MPAPAAPSACPNAHGNCQTINAVLSRVGDRWSVLVIFALRDGRRRFNELKRELDISQRMLSLTLRDLERDGLVSRHYHPTIPPKVEYELTALGQSLRGPVGILAEWALANQTAIDAARAAFDAQNGGESDAA